MKIKKNFAGKLLKKEQCKELLAPFTMSFMLIITIFFGANMTSINVMNAFCLYIPLLMFSIFLGYSVNKGMISLYNNYKEEDSSSDMKNKVIFHGLILSIIMSVCVLILMLIFKNIYPNIFNVTENTKLKYLHMFNVMTFLISILPISIFMSSLCKFFKNKVVNFSLGFNILFELLASIDMIDNYSENGISMVIFSLVVLQIIFMSIPLSKNNKETKFIVNKEFRIMKLLINIGLKETYTNLLEVIYTFFLLFLSSYSFGEEGLYVSLLMVTLFELGKMFNSLLSAFKNQIYLYRTEYNNVGVKKTVRENLKLFLSKSLVSLIILLVCNFTLTNLFVVSDMITYINIIESITIISAITIIMNNGLNIVIKYYETIGQYKLSLIINVLHKVIYPILFMYLSLIINPSIFNIYLSLLLSTLLTLVSEVVAVLIIKSKNKNLSYPLLLDMQKQDIILFDISLSDVKNIVDTKDILFDTLKEKGIDSKKINIICLLVEDLLVLIKEKNNSNNKKDILSEVTIMLRKDNSIRVIFKDDGGEINITDTDSDIGSLRQYIVNELLINKVRKDKVAGIEFNRNIVEFR